MSPIPRRPEVDQTLELSFSQAVLAETYLGELEVTEWSTLIHPDTTSKTELCAETPSWTGELSHRSQHSTQANLQCCSAQGRKNSLKLHCCMSFKHTPISFCFYIKNHCVKTMFPSCCVRWFSDRNPYLQLTSQLLSSPEVTDKTNYFNTYE